MDKGLKQTFHVAAGNADAGIPYREMRDPVFGVAFNVQSNGAPFSRKLDSITHQLYQNLFQAAFIGLNCGDGAVEREGDFQMFPAGRLIEKSQTGLTE